MKKCFLYMTVLLCLLCTSCAQPQQPQNVPEPPDNGILSEAPAQTESAPDQNTEPPETSADPNPPQADLASQDADYYSVCTNFSKSEVEQFAKEIRALILASNWEELSKHIAYPITIGGVVYEDSTAFVNAPFDSHLLSKTIAAIQNEDCTDMFCKYSGIMMGNGEVWIGEVLNEDGTSAGLRVISLLILKEAQTLRTGTWLVQNKDTASYYFFDADGTSGRTASLETGAGKDFRYHMDGENILFHMGADNVEIKGVLSMKNADYATIIWENGQEDSMTFITDKNSDEFHFFSNDELCAMAIAYYTSTTGEAAPLAAADIGADTVTVQLYNNLGGHNSTCAWYQVSRFTGKGIDVNSRQEIDISQ